MIGIIPVTFEEDPTFHVHFEEDPHFCVDFENLTVVESDVEVYTGECVIIPSDDLQIISVQNKKVLTNIEVKPVPSNYGRISWDGFRLMIY